MWTASALPPTWSQELLKYKAKLVLSLALASSTVSAQTCPSPVAHCHITSLCPVHWSLPTQVPPVRIAPEKNVVISEPGKWRGGWLSWGRALGWYQLLPYCKQDPQQQIYRLGRGGVTQKSDLAFTSPTEM